MSKTYRVKKRSSQKDKKSKMSPRWPWICLCLLSMAFIVATGIASSKPAQEALWVNWAMVLARGLSGTAGVFGMAFCFMLILNSLVKLAKPNAPLPRFVWGLWVLLISVSAIYHGLKAPWDECFTFAKTGGGGGLVGACFHWFFRVSLGKFGAFLVLTSGLAVGFSLVANKTAYAPFSLIWMGALSIWQWFRRFLADFFRPVGPPVEEFHVETGEYAEEEEGLGLHSLLESEESAPRYAPEPKESSLSSAISDIRQQLAASEASATQSQEQEDFSYMSQPSLDDIVFYELPGMDILEKSSAQRRQRSTQDLEARGRIIEKTLLSFGVVAKVVNYVQGPAVTQFELQPGPGVKIASIVNLSQDLALALAAPDVRMEAPIPGKSAVGVEVPNRESSLVHLRDVLETKEFRNSKSPLTLALGKDIAGRAMITTLEKCLHLLIAGATGSGKSVCINSIIASILYKARPDQVKLILIDPKRVELTMWSQVPHLIAPVVSDPKKASGALRWAIKEMESRYEKFTKVGTRDIERYNQVATPPGSPKPALPYVVIIIDELSDLMMVSPAEVEDSIFRLAQMARAAGIYLIVATQRPSVDVITGTVKANIPSRLAFAVASQIDSRTILDMAGAEKLLGRGDMLFYPVGASKPSRAQGCYLSEREIDELVSFVSAQAKPQFAPDVLTQPEVAAKESEIQEDAFFSQALRIVVEAKQASVSLLQRRLPIGYSRAARLIDAMEMKGYVGPYEGSKPREVRITIQEFMRLFENGENKETTAAEQKTSKMDDPMQTLLKRAEADYQRSMQSEIKKDQSRGAKR